MNREINLRDVMDAFMSPACQGLLQTIPADECVRVDRSGEEVHITVTAGPIATRTVAGLLVALGIGDPEEVVAWAQERAFDDLLGSIEIHL